MLLLSSLVCAKVFTHTGPPELSLFLFCAGVTCGDPEPTGFLNGIRSGAFSCESTVFYTCNQGFRLQGNQQRTCQGNGEWTGSTPTCVPGMTCAEDDRADPNFTNDGSLAFRSRCNEKKNAKTTRRWIESAHFFENFTFLNCSMCSVSVTCPALPFVPNAQRFGDSNRIGDQVTYTCNECFVSSGPTTITCQSPGVWVPTPPMCAGLSFLSL